MSDAIEFQAWPKMARLSRPCTITEKLDGTNAAVGVMVDTCDVEGKACPHLGQACAMLVRDEYTSWIVYAQSRTRIITPEQDNFGFAGWVQANAAELVPTLGEGLHHGEFWGSGIQRGYGLVKGDKRFSLFNTPRYTKPEFDLTRVPGLATVPILYEGLFTTGAVEQALYDLNISGSVAAPGFKSPEGVVVFHTAAQVAFKKTIKDDEAPKRAKGNV